MKSLFVAASVFSALGFSAGAFGATAEVLGMTQDPSDGTVVVTYSLSGGPAIVTFDAVTNAEGVAGNAFPIGDRHFQRVTGDVNRVVQGDGATKTIVWKMDDSIAGFRAQGTFRPRIRVWDVAFPPDYMVVDLVAETGSQDRIRYYASADAIPGGLLDNRDYRESKVVMRKIHAPVGGKWVMGGPASESTRDNEGQHEVLLSYDYYIGVFEVTQMQLFYARGVSSKWSSNFKETDWKFRPAENCHYGDIRGAGSSPTATPSTGSFLEKFRTLTNVAFDLPTEMQWEYACRACNGDNRWGDGSVMSADNLKSLARYKMNGGYIDGTTAPGATCSASNGTACVGTYNPNGFGLYDMHGNVAEITRDTYVKDITDTDGTVVTSGVEHTVRGGSYLADAVNVRSAYRMQGDDDKRMTYVGFRLFCPSDASRILSN